MADKKKVPKHEEFYKKSNKAEEVLEETLRQTRLNADEAHVAARKDLLNEMGTLDLKDQKSRDYFSEGFSKYLVKSVMPKVYEEMGIDKPGTDPKYSKRFVDMILQNYAGVNRNIVKTLIDRTRDVNRFVDTYLQQYLPRHLNQLEDQYRVDAHEHIKKADKSDKKALLKSTGLDKILDEAGQELIMHKDNVGELGRLIRQKEKQGALSSEYVRSSDILGNYVKD